jgi:hypothetical protein
MSRLPSLAILCASALLSGCVAIAPYYPWAPTPATPVTTGTTPASFDKSWDAALGAAGDAGILISRADRANGRIAGTKGGASVTIDVQPQADKTLKVTFNAPDSKEASPTLGERWQAAYNKRMGR